MVTERTTNWASARPHCDAEVEMSSFLSLRKMQQFYFGSAGSIFALQVVIENVNRDAT